MKTSPEVVAQRVRIEIARAGMNQTSVARHIGVSLNSINEIARGNNFPRVGTLIALAELFGCTTDYLLGLNGEENHT